MLKLILPFLITLCSFSGLYGQTVKRTKSKAATTKTKVKTDTPSLAETKEWVIKKLAKNAMTFSSPIDGTTDHYKFRFEGNELIIYSQNISLSGEDKCDIVDEIHFAYLKKISLHGPSNVSSKSYLTFQTSDTDIIVERRNCVAHRRYGDSNNNYSDNSNAYSIGFDISGESDLQDKFNKALANFKSRVKK